MEIFDCNVKGFSNIAGSESQERMSEPANHEL